MPSVLNEYVGDGVSRSFNIAMEGGYLSRDYVKFYVRPLEALLDWTPLTNNEVTWTGDFSFTTESAIPVGSVLVVFRETPLTPLVDFQNTSRITEKNLDTATSQSIHIAAEASDTVGRIQVVAQDAKQESAQALADAQAAAASADTAAAAAIAASSAATAAQAAAIQAGADAEDAALSAATAAGVAAAAALTANAANATAIAAAADAAAAVTVAGNADATANSAASQAGTAVSTANTALTTANSASTAAGTAVATSNSASATANTAMTIANEAKDLVDEAVSGAVVSFNGRAGVVTPQAGDYTKSMVGLGDVDNTADLAKPISTATSDALGLKADTSYVNTQLATKADSTTVTNALELKADTTAMNNALASNAAADRNRDNHTGTQPASTIANFVAEVRTAFPDAIQTGVDLKTLKRTGFYPVYGPVGAPSGTVGFLEVFTYTVDWVVQRYYDIGEPTLSWRRNFYNGDTWSPWFLETNQTNSARTIATGGIIESVANANGTYTKFADGTLICVGAVTTPVTARCRR